MTQEALIRRLQISCLGLDAIDPLRLLVDDVIAALAQTQRTWVGLTDEEVFEICNSYYYRDIELVQMIEAKLKEKNT
jgi:hypothetical protein